MEAWAVRLDVTLHFTAYILHGDLENADRTWVCVRAAESSPAVSWLGCWSRASASSAEQLRELLRGVTESIGDPIRVGPYGPVISNPGFFEGWDSWGVGTPGPIVGFRPWESHADVLVEQGLGSLEFPEGGLHIRD